MNKYYYNIKGIIKLEFDEIFSKRLFDIFDDNNIEIVHYISSKNDDNTISLKCETYSSHTKDEIFNIFMSVIKQLHTSFNGIIEK